MARREIWARTKEVIQMEKDFENGKIGTKGVLFAGSETAPTSPPKAETIRRGTQGPPGDPAWG